MVRLNPLQRISCIDNQRIATNDRRIVERAVIRADHGAVNALRRFGLRHGSKIDVAVLQYRDEGIGIA